MYKFNGEKRVVSLAMRKKPATSRFALRFHAT